MDAKPVQRFTEEEAKSKVGRLIRSKVEFYRVPEGTPGRVVDIHKISEDQFDVWIEWELPNRPEPIHDRFGKSTYERLLVEE